MDINTIIIVLEKENATEFKIFQFKIFVKIRLPLVIEKIAEYCIVRLKTIYSNIKFFIFQLICILAKMPKRL